MKIPARLLIQSSLWLVLSLATMAQPRNPLPTLTTEDIVASRPAVATPPSKDAVKGKETNAAKDAPKTSETKADAPQKDAEKNWHERLSQAQEKARGLEQQADQAELTITQLRNQLFSAAARAPEANGQLNARIADVTAQLKQLRAAAKTAQQEVETLQAEGKSNQFQAQAAALTNEKGEPDSQSYQSELDKLQSELQAAQARIAVLQTRLTSQQGESLKQANGDNFKLNRLRAEKEQAAGELDETRAKIATLTTQLQTHRQKAAAAGVPLIR